MPLLHYVELGDTAQPSIVIIHGLFGSHKNWSRISKQLATRYHVIAVDCRNHGDSFSAFSMSYQEMSDDIFKLLQHLNIRHVILMGHSMGGKIAMQFAAQHPSHLSKLIVVDITPVNYQHDYDDLMTPLLAVNTAEITSRKQVDEQLKNEIPDDFIRLFLLQSLAHKEGRWYWKADWQNLKDNMANIVSAPEVDEAQNIQSLFVFGENSDYYTQQGLKRVKTLFPQAQIEVIKGGNHWLHYEHAKAFMALLNRYL